LLVKVTGSAGSHGPGKRDARSSWQEIPGALWACNSRRQANQSFLCVFVSLLFDPPRRDEQQSNKVTKGGRQNGTANAVFCTFRLPLGFSQEEAEEAEGNAPSSNSYLPASV
jgi:hypothetical protein